MVEEQQPVAAVIPVGSKERWISSGSTVMISDGGNERAAIPSSDPWQQSSNELQHGPFYQGLATLAGVGGRAPRAECQQPLKARSSKVLWFGPPYPAPATFG